MRQRVAIVTGGARGIGAGISKRLSNDGRMVYVWDLEGPIGDATWFDDFDDVRPMEIDVSSERAVNDAVARIVAEHGGIDILVNNAAISPKHDGKRTPPAETPTAEWQAVMEVNLNGPFYAMRAVLPSMIEAKWGRIVNISSRAGRSGSQISGLAYGVAKTGINGLTRTMAADVGKHGVTVNSVAPGRIATPMTARTRADISAKSIASIPVGREGQPEDIAGLVSYLAGEDSGFVSGAVIDINGGAYMAP